MTAIDRWPIERRARSIAADKGCDRRAGATTTRLGERLARRGIDIEAIKAKVAAFGVAVPSWGVGTGGTRFARFPGPGEPRDIFDKLEDCAVIHQLTGATPTVSLHIPWDKATTRHRREQGGAALGLGFDAMNSNTFSGRARPAALLQVRLAQPHRRRPCAPQAVEHNLECIEIGKALGSKALTVWIGDGSNFPGQSHFTRAFERYLEAMRRSMPACRTTGGSSPSTRCTSRPSIRRSCRTGAPTT